MKLMPSVNVWSGMPELSGLSSAALGETTQPLKILCRKSLSTFGKAAARFDPEKSSEATFIGTIARRRVIDRQRQLGRKPTLESIDDHDVAGEDHELSQVDLGDDFRLAREALAELRPEQRRVILMSVVEGLTHFDIATATGLPIGNSEKPYPART